MSADGKVANAEQQLQATLNVIPAYAWYAVPSGALTFVNQRTADYLGLPNDHPLRLGIDIGGEWDSHIPLLHPDDHEEARRVWSTCLRTGRASEMSFRVRNAAGEYRWFLTRAEPLRASDGTLLYWIGVNLEIDDAKRAEEALQQSQFYLTEGQRLAHMGSWAFNADGFEYWSSELFRIHGLDPSGKPPTVGKASWSDSSRAQRERFCLFPPLQSECTVFFCLLYLSWHADKVCWKSQLILM